MAYKASSHVSKSLSGVSKPKTNGSTSHPFIGGQKHGTIHGANFQILCYNNFWFVDV
jgi:hypothetical protein